MGQFVLRSQIPKITIKYVAHLLRIRKVPDCSLGQHNAYPEVPSTSPKWSGVTGCTYFLSTRLITCYRRICLHSQEKYAWKEKSKKEACRSLPNFLVQPNALGFFGVSYVEAKWIKWTADDGFPDGNRQTKELGLVTRKIRILLKWCSQLLHITPVWNVKWSSIYEHVVRGLLNR